MRTVIYSALAMFGYAFSNVLLEQKLAKFNTLTILIFYTGSIFLVAMMIHLCIKTNNPSLAFPVGWDLFLMFMLVLLWFGADYFYISAFTAGGNLLTIVSIIVMFPVVASAIRLFWVRETPNLYHVGGYILAVAAMLLVAKGNILLNTPK